MGIYLNPGNDDFQMALDSEIYVDKSMLIKHTNKVIRTEQRFICVSRPRRFGKSMAANMLAAYYNCEHDSWEMFASLKVSREKESSESFEKHLNKYNVIRIDIQKFANPAKTADEMLSSMQKRVIKDIRKSMEVDEDEDYLPYILENIFARTGRPFVIIIDEWDCVLRDEKFQMEDQKTYLDFLCVLFKGQSYVALAYMTGILPIKKYGKHSAINMFTEISMTNDQGYAEFTGFTEGEVETLCEQYHMSIDETKRWYDGYNLKGISIYNPQSVVTAMMSRCFDNYWNLTETYNSLKNYIRQDCYGLKDKVTRLIAGEEIEVNPDKFQNDMTSINSADDVFTLLIHLGYLTYDFYTGKARIPNSEVAQEFINSMEDGGWEEVMNAIKAADDLLDATLSCDEEKVAELIDKAHSENASILKYNDENSLACVISIAYYSARRTYFMYREVPAGKGYADIVFVPRKNVITPALVVELKYNKSAESAIGQIKDRNYADFLKDYSGEIILVGINYDKDDPNKMHTCRIEKIRK